MAPVRAVLGGLGWWSRVKSATSLKRRFGAFVAICEGQQLPSQNGTRLCKDCERISSPKWLEKISLKTSRRKTQHHPAEPTGLCGGQNLRRINKEEPFFKAHSVCRATPSQRADLAPLNPSTPAPALLSHSTRRP